MSIRQIVKSILPNPVLDFYGKMRKKKKPKNTRYHGKETSVLQCVIAYNEHGGYCVPLSAYMHCTPQAVFKGAVWERDTIEFLTSKLGHGDMIHAGTFFGDFLPAISRANGIHTIWAFEPNPEAYRCAQITTLVNNLDNVRLFNKGLGDHDSIEKMKVVNNDGVSMGCGSRMAKKAKRYDPQTLIDVEVVAIDEIIPRDREISLIHLDIEGFEKEALSGGIQTIKRCRPILLIETLPDAAWLKSNILELGYHQHPDKIDQNYIFYQQDD